MKKLNHFHTTCQKKILGITWQKHIPDTKVLTGLSIPSYWCNHSFVGPIMFYTWKIPATQRNCSSENCLRASALKQARKSASKAHWRSPRNLSASPLISRNIYHRSETSGTKLSNGKRKYIKPEETQKLSSKENLEKAHQPLPPSFLALTAQDSSAHRLLSLAIYALTDASLNHKIDQMVRIDYDGQRRIYICVCVCERERERESACIYEKVVVGPTREK